MMHYIRILCVLVIVIVTSGSHGYNLNPDPKLVERVFKWNQIEFDIDSQSLPDPYNNFPSSAVHHKGKLFITTPRRKPGVISTMNYVSTDHPKGSSPKLIPYPDLKSNELHPNLTPDKLRIISVYRPRVDVCNRLWFVDTGTLEYWNNVTQVQPPSIWIFNLENDEFIRRFEIPKSIVTIGSGMVSIAVDADRLQCDNAFVYIADLLNSQIHVYSFADDKIWSFSHNYFHFDPLKGDFNIDGIKFRFGDGVFSIALGPKTSNGFGKAFFHSLSSNSEFYVSTRILRNEAASKTKNSDDFKFLRKRIEDGQSCTHMYDPISGVIFFTQVQISGISCWNPRKPYSLENQVIITTDEKRMIYPSDVYVDHDGYVWFLSSRLSKFSLGRLDPTETNYRIFRFKGTDAVRGTNCEITKN